MPKLKWKRIFRVGSYRKKASTDWDDSYTFFGKANGLSWLGRLFYDAVSYINERSTRKDMGGNCYGLIKKKLWKIDENPRQDSRWFYHKFRASPKRHKEVRYVSCVALGGEQGVRTSHWMVQGSNHGEVEIFRASPDRPRGPPSLLCTWGPFPGGKAVGALRWPPTLHAAVRLKSRPIPPLPVWVFTACSRVYFTFYLLRTSHTQSTAGSSPWDMKLTSHIYLMLRLRMRGPVLLIPPTWLMAGTGTTSLFCITFAVPTQKITFHGRLFENVLSLLVTPLVLTAM